MNHYTGHINFEVIRNLIAVITLLCLLDSCDNDWRGTAIETPGVYSFFDNEIKVTVENKDKLIEYSVQDASGKILVKDFEVKFSSLYPWALYLSADRSLWLFSTDMGNGVWVYDQKRENYRYIEVRKENIPEYIYNSLPRFFNR